jgi:hypothetical protein
MGRFMMSSSPTCPIIPSTRGVGRTIALGSRRNSGRCAPHLGEAQVFLEIGAGDCRLCFAVSRLERRVVAVDVSDRLLDADQTPGNFSFALSDGTSIPVPAEASMSPTAIS